MAWQKGKRVRPRLGKGAVLARRRARLRLVLLVVLVLALFAALVTFLRHPRFRISEVLVAGTELVDTSEVEKTVRAVLSRHFLSLIPMDNAFIYSRGSLRKALVDEYSRVGSVELHLASMNTLVVTITEHQAAYLWCTRAVETRACYHMNEDGLLFSRASASQPAGVLTFSGWVEQEPEGGSILRSHYDKGIIDSVNAVRGVLGEKGEELIHAELIGNGDIRVNTISGLDILYNIGLARETLRRNINIIMAHDGFVEDRARFGVEYVDFRFGNKVYYKPLEFTSEN